ncbi:MAG TPA: DUF308 domain-containing protein [Gammaproteobacteria bacterium]|nr:DUF308 domain-containing protein [Gammaproteobacteria bacterium]
MTTVTINSKNLKIAGAIAILLGLLAMLSPTVTGISIGILVGILVLLAGLVRIVWAFRARDLGRGLLLFAIGGITFIAGLAMITHPMFASGVLTVILTLYFLLDGAAELASGYFMRPAAGSGWLMFAGAISVLLGLMIWSQFPLSGAWAVGILLGIKLLFIGLITITVGHSRIRR